MELKGEDNMENNNNIYKKKSEETFNKQANNYDLTYNGRHARKLYSGIMERVESLNPKTLLDVGCGNGTILSKLSSKSGISLSGVDLSCEMIKIAKNKLNDKVELKLGDSENLPWGKEKFDVIICSDSFHHYPNPQKVLIEMARVLKPNGHIIIGDPWMITPLRQISNAFFKYGDSGDFRIYSKNEISELLIKAGFKTIDFKLVNLSSFIVTAKVDK
jgi:Methylase involved in ubiquinone/menaquinone biosynthesis